MAAIKVGTTALDVPRVIFGTATLGNLFVDLPEETKLEISREWFKTGEMVGMKPAGGISNAKLALHYLIMVKETLGEMWLDNHWFRFGASSLANDVLMQIAKQKTGIYQSANYFSVD